MYNSTQVRIFSLKIIITFSANSCHKCSRKTRSVGCFSPSLV